MINLKKVATNNDDCKFEKTDKKCTASCCKKMQKNQANSSNYTDEKNIFFN